MPTSFTDQWPQGPTSAGAVEVATPGGTTIVLPAPHRLASGSPRAAVSGRVPASRRPDAYWGSTVAGPSGGDVVLVDKGRPWSMSGPRTKSPLALGPRPTAVVPTTRPRRMRAGTLPAIPGDPWTDLCCVVPWAVGRDPGTSRSLLRLRSGGVRGPRRDPSGGPLREAQLDLQLPSHAEQTRCPPLAPEAPGHLDWETTPSSLGVTRGRGGTGRGARRRPSGRTRPRGRWPSDPSRRARVLLVAVLRRGGGRRRRSTGHRSASPVGELEATSTPTPGSWSGRYHGPAALLDPVAHGGALVGDQDARRRGPPCRGPHSGVRGT